MQEPKTTKDDELCKKVNDSLNNPPTPGESGSGGLANLPPGLASIGDQLGKVFYRPVFVFVMHNN